MMKIASLRERAKFERRCAITPETTKLYISKGFSVILEKSIGKEAGFQDQAYIDAGAQISNVPLEIISDADIILKVQPSPLNDPLNEIEFARKGAIIIGLLSPFQNPEYISQALKKNLVGISMEQMPRITKAQNMDVLSSQSNLAGYRASLEAVYHFDKAIPMMMTAAGTIIPAKVLIIGVGVAGLQAIATMKRMGAVVTAYDVRSATKEQAESLGAKFISPELNNDLEDKSGYAKESSAKAKTAQDEFLKNIIKNYDIIITTALIPGKPAPRLLDEEMVSSLKSGSVIVDMAVVSGGNVAGSKIDDMVITDEGIKIIGWSNLASKVATDSSKLYAKNLYNFLVHATASGKFDLEDEIVKQVIVC
jgi:H+-translocating NAD(P) transhydrogenase subunit alpha